jgi:hypothetical protein
MAILNNPSPKLPPQIQSSPQKLAHYTGKVIGSQTEKRTLDAGRMKETTTTKKYNKNNIKVIITFSLIGWIK